MATTNPTHLSGSMTPEESIKKLQERILPIVGSLSHLHTSLNQLRDNLGRMAELSARANAAMLLLVGLPRIFRSDLYHMVAYGAGRTSHVPGGGARLPSMPGAPAGTTGAMPNMTGFTSAFTNLTDTLGKVGSELQKKVNEMLLNLQGQQNGTFPEEASAQAKKELERVAEIQSGKKQKMLDALKAGGERYGPSRPIESGRTLPQIGVPGGWGHETTRLEKAFGSRQRRQWISQGLNASFDRGGFEGAAGVFFFRNLQLLDGHFRGASVGLQRFVHNIAKTHPALRQFLLGFNGVLRGGLKGGLLGRLSALGQKAAIPTLYGGAVAGSLLSAASPDAFATLTGSVKLLSVVLGKHLIPVAMLAAFEIQKLAFALHDMDPATGKLIGTIGGITVAIGGTVTVLGMLAGALNNMGTLVMAVSARLGAAAGPIGMLVVAIGALLAKVGYDTYRTGQLNQSEKDIDKDAGAGTGIRQDVLDQLSSIASEKDLKKRETKLETLKKQLTGERQTQEDVLRDVHGQYSNGFEGRMAHTLMEGMSLVPGMTQGFSKLLESATKPAPPGSGLEAMRQGMAAGSSPNTIINNLREKFIETERTLKFVQNQKAADLDPTALTEKQKQARAAQGSMMLLALNTIKGTAQYSSIEEAHKRTQVAAAGSDPLTQQIEKWQNENLQELVRQSDLVGDIKNLILQMLERQSR